MSNFTEILGKHFEMIEG